MKTLKHNWWILAAQGFFLAALGSMAVINNNIDLNALIQYLGLIFLAFGVILTFVGLRARRKGSSWGFPVISGFLQLAVGLLILANPSSSSDIFSLIIGIWALVMAAIQLVIGAVSKNGRLIFFGNALISGVFGALIIWYNFDDPRSLSTLVGIYSIILGITIFYYSIRLRMWTGQQLKKSEEKERQRLKKEEDSSTNQPPTS